MGSARALRWAAGGCFGVLTEVFVVLEAGEGVLGTGAVNG